MKFALVLIFVTGSIATALPHFHKAQVRAALLKGERLGEFVAEIEKIPRAQRLEQLIEAAALRFPPDTRITHFADIHYEEGWQGVEAVRSLYVQLAFISWWSTHDGPRIAWELLPVDLALEDGIGWFRKFVLEPRKALTPPGQFEDLTSDPRVRTNAEQDYVRGGPGFLFENGLTPALFGVASYPLSTFMLENHRESETLFLFELREIAALLRLEDLLHAEPALAKDKIVLVYGVGHDFEGRYNRVPNLTFTTVVPDPAKPQREAFMTMWRSESGMDECLDGLETSRKD